MKLKEELTRTVNHLGWDDDGTAESNDIKRAFIMGYNAAIRDISESCYLKQITVEVLEDEGIELEKI